VECVSKGTPYIHNNEQVSATFALSLNYSKHRYKLITKYFTPE